MVPGLAGVIVILIGDEHKDGKLIGAVNQEKCCFVRSTCSAQPIIGKSL